MSSSQDERSVREQQIKELLERGLTRSQIAREIGISPSTVSRYAAKLGFRTRSTKPMRYDWPAICEYYQAGYSVAECQERFGFTQGAWHRAVARGDVTPRPRAVPRYAHKTRRAVEGLLEKGLSQADITRALGISKATVAFHVRNLGHGPDERFSRRYDWDRIQEAYDGGLSIRQCCELFGFNKSSWSQAVARGDVVPRPRALPIEELLVRGRKRGRENLKRRLIEAGIKENRCERCGIAEWCGEPLNMQLHHINGDGLDNRLKNLEFLCGNCHSQTDSYGGRNGHRKQQPARAAADRQATPRDSRAEA